MYVYFGTFNGGKVRYWGRVDTWFLSYESLPEPMKDAISVLAIVGEGETVIGVGTRYKHHYSLDNMPRDIMRGCNGFEETLDE